MAIAVNRTMPWDVLIAAQIAIPAFYEIVLPYISATDNSAFDPQAHQEPSGCAVLSGTLKPNFACDGDIQLLQNTPVSCYNRPMAKKQRQVVARSSDRRLIPSAP